jgi:RND family efflux transporter MFP subunit
MKTRTLLGGVAAAAALAVTGWILNRPGPGLPASEPPTVATATVDRRDLFKEVTIQAEFRPYQEVELHAKVAGYLRRIPVDFGDRVKAGDPIAVLEVPELGDELNHASAAMDRARAEARDARLDHERLAGVARTQPNLVSQQDLDAAEARDRMAAAALAGAEADVGKYRTLESYTRITAPFDGVVTARYADPGALIQAASSSQTQSLPLVRLSENGRLRLDFPVSVTYAGYIHAGDPVEIRLEGSARVIRAPITRFSRRIMADTRTMQTEVEVPNPDLLLIPGMYATVVLHLENRPNALALPIEAVAGTGAPSVYRISPDGLIEDRPVELGIESPDYYEVLRGLAAGDRVIVGSRAGLQPGEKVRYGGSS